MKIKLNCISEQFPTSSVASTPKGEGVAAAYTMLKIREKRHAQLIQNASKKAKQTRDNSASEKRLRKPWEQCIGLIRNLCAYNPNERLTASAALRHPFISQLETNLESWPNWTRA